MPYFKNGDPNPALTAPQGSPFGPQTRPFRLQGSRTPTYATSSAAAFALNGNLNAGNTFATTGAIDITATTTGVYLSYPVTSYGAWEITRVTAQTTTSATTLVGTLAETMLAGDTIIISVSYQVLSATTPTITSITSPNGTFTSLEAAVSAPATPAAAAGTWSQTWIGTLSADSSSEALTVTFSAAISGKSFSAYAFRNTTTIETNPSTLVTWAGSTGSPTSSLTSPSLNFGDLLYIASSSDQSSPTYTQANDTTLGTWSVAATVNSAVGGGNAAGNLTQYKVVNASGTDTFTAGATGATTSRYSLTQAFAISGVAGAGISLIATATATLNSGNTGSGAIDVSATTTNELDFPVTASAFIQLLATTTDTETFPVSATGAIDVSGSTTVVLNYAITGTGAIAIAFNSATANLKYSVTATGSISLNASASDQETFPVTATGAISITATSAIIEALSGTGAIALVGTATQSLSYPTTASGAFDVSGSANALLKYVTTGSGSISLIATTTDTETFPVTASATITLTASAGITVGNGGTTYISLPGGGSSATFTSNAIPAGANYVVVVDTSQYGEHPISITDNYGGVWTSMVNGTNGTPSGYGHYFYRSTVGTGVSLTLTINYIYSTNIFTPLISFWVKGHSGISTINSAYGGYAFPSLNSPTTYAAGDLVVAVGGSYSATAAIATAGSGWTALSSVSPRNTSEDTFSEYQYATAASQNLAVTVTPPVYYYTIAWLSSLVFTSSINTTYATAAITLTGSATATLTSPAVNVGPVSAFSSASTYTYTGYTAPAGSNIFVFHDRSTASIQTITDSAGGTWQSIPSTSGFTPSGSTKYEYMFVRTTSSTGAAINITFTGSVSTSLMNSVIGYTTYANTWSNYTSSYSNTAIPSDTSTASYFAGDTFLSFVYGAIGTVTGTFNPDWQPISSSNSIGYPVWLISKQTATSFNQTITSNPTYAGAYNYNWSNTVFQFGYSVVITGAAAISVDGTATNSLTYPVTASGSFDISGAGTETLSYPVTASGSINLIANVTNAETFPVNANSFIDLTGTVLVHLIYSSSGSAAISLIGSGTETIAFATTATGAISLNAAGTETLRYPVTTNSNISLVATGALGAIVYYPVTATGSITLMAGMPDTLDYPASATGSIGLVASTPDTLTYPVITSGAINLSGSAYYQLIYQVDGSAIIALNGQTKPVVVGNGSFTLVARADVGFNTLSNGTGFIQLSSIASPTLTFAQIGAGRFDLLGAAINALTYPANASGSVTLNATAIDTLQIAGFVGWGIPL
jgi:hypothetical protein